MDEAAANRAEPGLTLVITEDDFQPDVRARIKAEAKGKHRVLGGDEVRKRLFDALPSVIARRLEEITPASFEIAEVQLNIDLDVKIGGFGVGGAMTVTFSPRADDAQAART